MEKFQPFSLLHAAALATIPVAAAAVSTGAVIFALVAGAMALPMAPWRFSRAT